MTENTMLVLLCYMQLCFSHMISKKLNVKEETSITIIVQL